MTNASPPLDLRVEVRLSPRAVMTHDAAHEDHSEAPEEGIHGLHGSVSRSALPQLRLRNLRELLEGSCYAQQERLLRPAGEGLGLVAAFDGF